MQDEKREEKIEYSGKERRKPVELHGFIALRLAPCSQPRENKDELAQEDVELIHNIIKYTDLGQTKVGHTKELAT